MGVLKSISNMKEIRVHRNLELTFSIKQITRPFTVWVTVIFLMGQNSGKGFDEEDLRDLRSINICFGCDLRGADLRQHPKDGLQRGEVRRLAGNR